MSLLHSAARVCAMACVGAALLPGVAAAVPAQDPPAVDPSSTSMLPCPRGAAQVARDVSIHRCGRAASDSELEAAVIAIGGASLLVIAYGVAIGASRRRVGDVEPDLRTQP